MFRGWNPCGCLYCIHAFSLSMTFCWPDTECREHWLSIVTFSQGWEGTVSNLSMSLDIDLLWNVTLCHFNPSAKLCCFLCVTTGNGKRHEVEMPAPSRACSAGLLMDWVGTAARTPSVTMKHWWKANCSPTICPRRRGKKRLNSHERHAAKDGHIQYVLIPMRKRK